MRKEAKDKQAVNPGSWQEEEDREEKRKILSFKLKVGHIHCSASVKSREGVIRETPRSLNFSGSILKLWPTSENEIGRKNTLITRLRF